MVGPIAELGPEGVIHAAAQVSAAVSMRDPHLDLSVNVQGTANVLGPRRRGCGQLPEVVRPGKLRNFLDNREQFF